MYCQNCGKKIPDTPKGIKFCPSCGSKLSFAENAPAEKTLFFKIPSIGNQTLEFQNSFIKFNSKILFREKIIKIDYKDISGIKYHSVQYYKNSFLSGQDFHINILGKKNNQIGIYFGGDGNLDVMNINLFNQIVNAINIIIKPFLLKNLIKEFEDKESLKISNLMLTPEGITQERLLIGPKFISWRETSYCLPEKGVMFIYAKDKKGDNKVWAKVKLSEMNSIILPELSIYFKIKKTTNK